jgi:hypothetical protein
MYPQLELAEHRARTGLIASGKYGYGRLSSVDDGFERLTSCFLVYIVSSIIIFDRLPDCRGGLGRTSREPEIERWASGGSGEVCRK